jgi:hypothetical protein
MGDVFPSIDEKLSSWIQKQQLFFVSTAPLSDSGLINCSPKGLDSFRILDPNTVAYADFNGSGIETAAHLQENGRILIMFCALEGAPKILRLHGVAEYHRAGSAEFDQLQPGFDIQDLRGIVKIELKRISDSCGYGVPKFKFVEERPTLPKWCDSKTPDQMAAYQQKHNRQSVDGLPGLD